MKYSTLAPSHTFAVVSGEAHIEALLAAEGVIVEPAFACRFDGFVNDTFTEYRNPSIYRPASVCSAQLESSLQWNLRWPGTYFLGFTMYDATGAEEELEVWLGPRQLTTVRADWHDNRVHLYVMDPAVTLKGGEQLRLVTAANRAAYRLENMVLLPHRPEPSPRTLEMHHLQAQIQPTADGRCQAVVTWITNEPAVGEVSTGRRKAQDPVPQVNHRLVLPGLDWRRKYAGEVISRIPGRAAARAMLSLPTTPPAPPTQIVQEHVPVQIGPASVSFAGWPVTTGMPFPSGSLGHPTRVRVLDPAGAEVPAQTEVTARWPDGSVKWLLLTFQAHLTANATAEYAIEYGQAVQSQADASPLEVRETSTGVQICTGPLQVEIDRSTGVLPGLVSLRDEATGEFQPITTTAPPGIQLVDEQGHVYHGRIDRIEENGRHI